MILYGVRGKKNGETTLNWTPQSCLISSVVPVTFSAVPCWFVRRPPSLQDTMSVGQVALKPTTLVSVWTKATKFLSKCYCLSEPRDPRKKIKAPSKFWTFRTLMSPPWLRENGQHRGRGLRQRGESRRRPHEVSREFFSGLFQVRESKQRRLLNFVVRSMAKTGWILIESEIPSVLPIPLTT